MGNADTSLTTALDAKAVTPGSPELRHLIDAIAAGAEARDRGESSTHDAIALVRAAKLGLYRLPASQGGASLPQLYELVLDLAEADSNIPHILHNHFAFVEKALRNPASPRYARWLGFAREGQLAGLGASELGTQKIGDGDGLTRLEPHDDGSVLNGTKYYSTGNLLSRLLKLGTV